MSPQTTEPPSYASGILEFNSRTIAVDGAGSTLSTDIYLEIGDGSNATLNLSNGGTASSTTTTAFGVFGGVTGAGSVTGTNSLLDVGTDLYLGFNGTGNLTVGSGGRVEVAGITYLGHQVGGTGNLTIDSGGTFAVGGANGIVKGAGSANFNLGGGTIEVTGADFSTNLPANLVSGTTSTVNTNGFNASLSGVVSGAGVLAKSGTGTLFLNGTNSYTGGTVLNSGTLQIGTVTSLGPAGSDITLNGGLLSLSFLNPAFNTVIFNGGTFANGNLDSAAAFEIQTGSLAASIGGPAALTKTGSGTFSLSGNNTYAGGTTLNEGTLAIATDAALGAVPATATPGSLTFNGGTLANIATFELASNRGILVGNSGGEINTATATTLTYNGNLSGSGDFTKSGAGTLNLGGINSYDGSFTLNEGTLLVDRADALTLANVVVQATLAFGDLTNVTLGDLTGTGTVNLGNTALSIGSQNNTGYFGGNLTGNGSFVKTGTGNYTLLSTSTYSGGTTINDGTLSVSNASNLGSGDITVSGGTLQGTGNLSLDTTILVDETGSTLATSGYLEVGSAGNGTLTISNGSQVSSGSTTAFGVLGSSNGTANISGVGSLLDANGTLFLGYLGTGTLNLSDSAEVTAADLRIGVVSGGNGTFNLASAGTLTTDSISLAESSGSTGTFNLNNGGILKIGGAEPITIGSGSGQLNLAGGTLEVTGTALNTSLPATLASETASTIDTNGFDSTVSGVLSGAGGLIKTGSGILTLSGNNIYTGGTTINSGNVSVTSLANLGLGNITIAGGVNFTLPEPLQLSSSRDFTVTGGGSSFTSSDAIVFGAGGGPVTNNVNIFNGGALTTSQSLTLADTGSSSQSTLSVTGGGSMVDITGDIVVGKEGTGIASVSGGGRISTHGLLVLGSNAGSSGTFNLNAGGFLEVGGTNGIRIGDGTGSLVGNGGTLSVTGSNLSTSVPVHFASGTTVLATGGNGLTFNGSISGAGGITKIDTGNLTFNTANDFSGLTLIAQGGLIIGNSNALQNSKVNMSSNTPISFSNLTDVNLGGLDTYNDVALVNDLSQSVNLIIGGGNHGSFIGGVVSGSGATLTKVGSGNLNLLWHNTYTGQTTVLGGTLHADHSGAVGPGDILVDGGSFQSGLYNANHNQNITVRGSESSFVGHGAIYSTGGQLTVSDGGTFSAVNSFSATSREISVSGDGSLISATDYIDLYSGSSLTLSDGAQVDSGRLVISESTANMGQDTNANLGGVEIYSGALNLNAGSTLTVNPGSDSLVTSTGQLNMAGGTLKLTGGVLSSDAKINFSGGTVSTIDTGPYAMVFGTNIPFQLGGTGGLIKNGSGTLSLPHGITYVGGTTVNEGTLFIDYEYFAPNSGNLTLNGGSINLGGDSLTFGTVLFNGGTFTNGTLDNATAFQVQSGSMSNALGGAGSLTKIGSETFTLSGDNSYTGTTYVNDGTLIIGHANALGGTTAITLNGGTLDLGTLSPTINTATFNGGTFTNGSLDNAAAYEVQSGSLSLSLGGSAALTKTGSGTFTLTGNNTYTGGTTVSSGTLSGNTASLQGNIINNSTVTFNQRSAGTYSEELSGSGSLIKSGIGNLTLSGANSYSGGTTVTNGTLTGNTTSLQGNIANNAALIFDQASTGTYSGDLSGSGSLTKIGIGNLTLSGSNSYSGGTNISAGTLTISSDAKLGADSGALDVNSGATLNAGTNFQTNRAVTLDGSGTQLTTNNGELVIGSAGTGSLALTNGATASTFNLTLGLDGGTGTVDINSGSSITVSNSTNTYSSSTLNLNEGGTLTTAALSNNGTFNLAGGTLRSGGTLSSSVASTLTNASTIDTNGYATTLSGNLTGSGSLAKSGTGTLSLSGTNDYTGGTTVTAGTLTGNTTSLQGNIENNAALVFDQAATGTYSDNLSGAGSLTKSGAGNLTLSGTNTYAGGTTVSGGTLTISSDAKLGAGSGSLAVNSGATLNAGTNFQTNRAVTLDGSGTQLTTNNGELVIGSAGTGSLAMTNGATASAFNVTLGLSGGTGTVDIASGSVLTANNSTNLSGTSTLNLNSGGTLSTAALSGSGTFNLAGGTLRSNGSHSSSIPSTLSNASTIDTNGYATTLAGLLSGSGSLTKSGPGTLNLTAANTYTGDTFVTGGTLSIGNGGASGLIASNITNGGTVTFNRSGDYNYNGVISGAGSVNQESGILRLKSAQTYTGTTTINGGILVLPTLGNQGLAASTSVEIASGAALDISNSEITLAGLSGAGSIYSFGGSNGHLSVNTTEGQSQTFSGNLGGSFANFALTKTGTGALTLSGNNSFSGGTLINAGSLLLANTSGSALGTGDVTVASGGTLGGTGSFDGALFVQAGGTFAPGNSPGLVTIGSGSVLEGILNIEIAGTLRGTEYDAIDVSGDGLITLGGDLNITLIDGYTPLTSIIYTVLSAQSISGAFNTISLPEVDGFTWDTSLLGSNGSLALNQVPEPAASALLMGVLALAYANRRRRK